MFKRLLLAVFLLVSFSIHMAAAANLNDIMDTMVIKEQASFKGVPLTQISEFLSNQTGLKVVCVPEIADRRVELELKANETLDKVFEALSIYYIKPVFYEKQMVILLAEGLYISKDMIAGHLYVDFPIVIEDYYPAKSIPIYRRSNYPEEYNAVGGNKFQVALTSPLSTFSIDVDTASYSNVRRFINDGSLPDVNAVRIEEMINYFTYDYPAPTNNHPFSINTEAAPCPWNERHSLVMIGLKGKNLEKDVLPNNLVFLIDVSGSMIAKDELPLIETTIKMVVSQMRPKDSISIVTYDRKTQVVLDSASGNEKDRIINAVEALGGGSTNGAGGLQLAYQLAKKNFKASGNNRIILATDGDLNVGAANEQELMKLIKANRDNGVFLSILGVGLHDIEKDNKMKLLADKGNGNYAYIYSAAEAKKVAGDLLAGTLFTIAKDVKLQVEFNPAKVKAYKLVGYENRVLPKRDFKNDKVDAGDMGAGHTVTALYEIIPADSSEAPAKVDPLQYQKLKTIPSTDLMLVKVRYKQPKADNSIFFSKHISTPGLYSIDKASDNFRFAAAVAEYGLLLKKSEFKGSASYSDIIKLAKGSKGWDEEGYRSEFIKLVEVSKLIDE
jgi:Ca-activated chloride channel family protein